MSSRRAARAYLVVGVKQREHAVFAHGDLAGRLLGVVVQRLDELLSSDVGHGGLVLLEKQTGRGQRPAGQRNETTERRTSADPTYKTFACWMENAAKPVSLKRISIAWRAPTSQGRHAPKTIMKTLKNNKQNTTCSQFYHNNPWKRPHIHNIGQTDH